MIINILGRLSYAHSVYDQPCRTILEATSVIKMTVMGHPAETMAHVEKKPAVWLDA